ncbi:MAG: SMC-Scp complex subunit ScpB [Desulfobacterales bacterium]|nr:SMC-Scp complex subunit ScpB [Desulfobacterales bacterium]
MENFDIKPVLESLFFVSESPVKLETLVEILPELNKEEILEGIRRIKIEYEDDSKGMELVEVAGGYQFRTKPKWAEWVQRLKKAKAVKLSHSALETLAIVAYRQPVIRPAIEEIRGVDSGWVLRTLLEKGLIKITGRKEMPGRPIVYGTTKAFLELFSLNTLSDLPTPKEIQPSPMPEEISKEEILKVEDKVEVQTEDKAESEDEVRNPMIHEIPPVDKVEE